MIRLNSVLEKENPAKLQKALTNTIAKKKLTGDKEDN